MRNSTTCFQCAQRHSRRVIFSTTQKYPKLVPPLAVRHENRQSRLLRYEKDKQRNKIFEYSPVERIWRKQFIALHLQKFIPPVSDRISCACTPMSYTLTSKSFTLSRKKSDDRQAAYLTFWTTLSFQKRRAKQGNWLRQGLTKTKPSVSFFVVAILYAHRRDLIHAKHFVSVLSPLASKSSGRSHTRKEICYEIKMMQFCCTLSHK